MGEVKIIVAAQGDAVIISDGYYLKTGEKVASFYIDSHSRIRAVSTSTLMGCPGFPSVEIEPVSKQNAKVTEIYFPEYEGWNVHCCGVGKTMAICLTKE